MSKTLGTDDGHAIDLLLDRSSMAHDTRTTSSTFAPAIGDAVVDRIGAAEHILRLVALMPAEDPRPDLVRRTLQRIDEKAGDGVRLSDSDSIRHHLGQVPPSA
jgi:hypothetical protein